MSVITEISLQQKAKNRCNVFLDGEFGFAVYVDTVVKFGLKKDFVLSEELKEEILNDDAKIYGFSLATKYLSKYVKTKKQIVTYLKGKGFSGKTLYTVIDKLTEYGFIDDEEYVRRYLTTYSATQGKRLADFKMMQNGVSKDVIEKVRADFDDNSKENALRIAQKRLKNKTVDKLSLSKTYRYIVSKGFSYEDAEYAVSQFKEND